MPKTAKQFNSVAEIWVPKNASESDIEAMAKRYQTQGLLPVVYKSGQADLVEMTCKLLHANCNL